MKARLLGPVDVWCAGERIGLHGTKIRTVLAMLLLARGHVVEDERLTRMLWGDQAPATAAAQLQTYASRLRRMLAGHGEIVRQRPGYLLRLGRAGCEVDLVEFDRLSTRGRIELRRGDHRAASDAFTAALQLWHGPALGGVSDTLIEAETPSLLERRLAVVEARIEAELALGRHAAVISELTGLVAAHPLREGLRGQLMTALYRNDRHADALRVYQEYRCHLVEELGIDPGPALQGVNRAVLRGDEAMAPPPVLAGPTPNTTAVPVCPQPPAPPADFTGREFELTRLRDALTGDRSSGARIAAVVGLSGTGKTALALRAANDLNAAFPDGALVVAMRDSAGRARPPAEVLTEICATVGGGSKTDPGNAYRQYVTSRRMLLVLDDAVDEKQLRPLLTVPMTCAVLITSRARLTALDGVRPVLLGGFSASESALLLARIAGEARVVADPASAHAIATTCGHLPIAVRIAGARLAARPHWSLASYAARLIDQRRTLDELRVADLCVRAVLSATYLALDDTRRVVLRQLAADRATTITVDHAARVLAVSRAEAAERLDELAEAHLLAVEGVDGRLVYQLPALLRLYAREQLPATSTVTSASLRLTTVGDAA
ncbi:BTAD domain-containing putative transcriptional regulator [Micromonospora inaquosa]|uniref:AfsR/SARP family transcriptional regulator n=1 Tax=Micromonospora inaquosa TaxID=2203716 RepID=UPI000F5FE812|nr:AfsR/SARP family transcriptional regulator [Micromonospora inaquosa]